MIFPSILSDVLVDRDIFDKRESFRRIARVNHDIPIVFGSALVSDHERTLDSGSGRVPGYYAPPVKQALELVVSFRVQICFRQTRLATAANEYTGGIL